MVSIPIYLLVASGLLLLGIGLFIARFYRAITVFIGGRAKLIQQYWILVSVLSILGLFGYIIAFWFSPADQREMYVNLTGQILTLFFAIFFGYFAFRQVAENRHDKLISNGYLFFKDKKFKRAREFYLEAQKINRNDFNIIANICELDVILRNKKDFSEKICLLEKISTEDSAEDTEKVIYYYLIIANYLLDQDLKPGKEAIQTCVKFINEKNLTRFGNLWQYSDLKDTQVYKSLDGDPKTIIENFIRYLESSLDEKDRSAFEGGNYLLKDVVK